jgi:hypothetical protein
MSDITSIDQSYHLNYNVEIGKFTCLAPDTTVSADGCGSPSGANGAFLGVAQESVLPNAMTDYSGGLYDIVSGTAWPAGAIPSSAIGRGIRTRIFGISRVVASGAITRGAYVNIANAAGQVKAVSEAVGTYINVVGTAIDAAVNAGDVIRVLVFPFTYKM